MKLGAKSSSLLSVPAVHDAFPMQMFSLLPKHVKKSSCFKTLMELLEVKKNFVLFSPNLPLSLLFLPQAASGAPQPAQAPRHVQLSEPLSAGLQTSSAALISWPRGHQFHFKHVYNLFIFVELGAISATEHLRAMDGQSPLMHSSPFMKSPQE